MQWSESHPGIVARQPRFSVECLKLSQAPEIPKLEEMTIVDLESTSSGDNICFAQMKFNDSSHLQTAFSAMNEMRKIGQLCDVSLDVCGTTLLAHKVVLASTSSYFNAMFNSEYIVFISTHNQVVQQCDCSHLDDMLEKNMSTISIHDVDPQAMKCLIEYAYTGQLVITEENVLTILPAANLLQILSIRDACCGFLLNQLHPSNCLGIRKFADTHSCQELQISSLKYALDNFQEVSQTDEFFTLSFDGILSLISNNQLNVADEETVYKSTIRWIKHDIKNRKEHFSTLLSYVRLPLIERNFLINQVIEETLIHQNSEAKDLVIEAMKYHLCPENRSEISTPRTQHRKPEGQQPYIFAIGGGSLFTTHSECEFYDPRDNKWTCFASTNQKRSRAGVTSLNRHIYAIGGYNGTKNMASVEFYDPLSNVWTYTANMGVKRSCHGAAQLNGLLYAAGGYDGMIVTLLITSR